VSFSAEHPPALGKPLLLAAVALIFLTALGGILDPVLAISRHIPRDYNEGWNAYWQQAAVHGQAMYPSPESTVVNNYPPLSFYIVGYVGEHLGDNIVAGRWIALLSLLVVATNIALGLRVTGSPRVIAALGAVMFLAALVSYAPDFVAMNDPQLLAHAIMTAALVILWRWRFSYPAAIISVLLMVSAGFVKHLLIPIPIATAVYLLLRRRRCFEVWFAASAAALTVGFSLIWLAYGASFFTALNLPRVYDVRRAIWETSKALAVLSPLVGVMALAVWSQFRERKPSGVADRVIFAICYLAIAGASGALSAGGAGVDKNAFFDFLIAACLCAALGVEALAIRSTPLRAAVTALCLAFVIAAGIRLPMQLEHVRTATARELEALRNIDLIKRLGESHVACETLALCYWARAPFELDFFSYGQKLAKATLPAAACESLFSSDAIDIVQVANDAEHETGSELLPAACNAVLGNHFKRVHDGAFGVLMTRNTEDKIAEHR
jgi:hypothetical protein